jgi:hypothetical protein
MNRNSVDECAAVVGESVIAGIQLGGVRVLKELEFILQWSNNRPGYSSVDLVLPLISTP